jgi:drug/metabolite transporter (DMT)-like permease
MAFPAPDHVVAKPKPDWLALAPLSFVLLWSTGFIGLRFGAPYAEPFTFMALRMLIVVALLMLVVAWKRPRWPADVGEIGHAVVAGLMVHAAYLSGVLYAITLGLPLGLVALIAGLQPVLTAVLSAVLLRERMRAPQWLGMTLGFCGVLLVALSRGGLVTLNVAAILAATVGLLGITLGTLYQKRFCASIDLHTNALIQFSATGVCMFVLASVFETGNVNWTGEFVFALAWLSVVLSLGAISLLYMMIRRGAASEVASLFFLTPAVTAVMAYLLFDERLSILAVLGLMLSAAGVGLVMKKSQTRQLAGVSSQ